MRYHPLGAGRYIVRLDPGDEVVTCLRQLVTEEDIVAGWITGIGSTSSAVMSWLDPESGEYQRRRFEEPMEVANFTGTISISGEDGRPFVHLHGVLAPRELLAYAGHVHEARTGAVMELRVDAYEEPLERHAVPDKAFPWLFLPGEPRPDGGEPTA